jgi:hypothetical protein
LTGEPKIRLLRDQRPEDAEQRDEQRFRGLIERARQKKQSSERACEQSDVDVGDISLCATDQSVQILQAAS